MAKGSGGAGRAKGGGSGVGASASTPAGNVTVGQSVRVRGSSNTGGRVTGIKGGVLRVRLANGGTINLDPRDVAEIR